MTTLFKREPRYFVFKISDMRKYLSRDKFELVGSIAEKLNAGRAVEGKVTLDAVVVESDWPEYESVWAMIEARMTGIAQSKKTHCDCENKSQCWEPCGELGHSTEHVKVHQQEPATEVVTTELARFKRMFHAACEALGEINEALGLDPDDGGAEPIIDAIAKLQAAQVQGDPVAWNEDQAYAWGRGCYEISQGATTGGKLFWQLTPKEQAYWVAKAAFEQATQQPKQEHGEPVAQHRDLHSHMMAVAHRAADKVTNNGQKFVSQKEVVRAICKAIQDDKNLISKLIPPAKQEQGEPVAFLANGVRFKLNFDVKGRVSSLWNYLAELDGRWVALVAAEDDCHLKLTAPQSQQKPSNQFVGALAHTPEADFWRWWRPYELKDCWRLELVARDAWMAAKENK